MYTEEDRQNELRVLKKKLAEPAVALQLVSKQSSKKVLQRAIIDSGSTATYLQETVFKQLEKAFHTFCTHKNCKLYTHYIRGKCRCRRA